MRNHPYWKTWLFNIYYILALVPLLIFYVYISAHWENVKLYNGRYIIHYDPMQYEGSVYFDIEGACMLACVTNIFVLLGNIISIIVKLAQRERLSRPDYLHMILTGIVLFFTTWQYGYVWAME